jgi:hypothetical protein
VQPHGVQKFRGREHIDDGGMRRICERAAHRAHGYLFEKYLRRKPPVAAFPAQHTLLRRVAEPDKTARKARMSPEIFIDGFPEEVHCIHHYLPRYTEFNPKGN